MMKIKSVIRHFWALTALVSMSLVNAQAQAALPHTVSFANNQVKANFTLGNTYDLALSLEFEQVVGLHPNNLDITAEVLLPTDPRVTSRLPSTLVEGVTGFPVLVSVSPKTDKGFAFEGLASIEFYTKAIHFDPTIPWRLFTSHDGATFEDITTLTSTGSYRARGSTGRFSDFIILLDQRDSDTIIDTKFAKLNTTVQDNRLAMSASLTNAIDPLMLTLETALVTLDTNTALSATDTLINLLSNASGNNIDDVWRSSGDIVNAKGDILSRLYTLRYSLRTL